MICQKEFSLSIVSCLGLSADAAWTYNPGGSPNQPPATVLFEHNFLGYYGQWAAQRSGGPITPTVVNWHISWASVAGRTLRVHATISGNVTRVGSGSNVICRADANGHLVTSTQVCAAGTTTPVNLDVIAEDPTLGGAAYIDINHQVPSDQTYSLIGIVEVSCYDP